MTTQFTEFIFEGFTSSIQLLPIAAQTFYYSIKPMRTFFQTDIPKDEQITLLINHFGQVENTLFSQKTHQNFRQTLRNAIPGISVGGITSRNLDTTQKVDTTKTSSSEEQISSIISVFDRTRTYQECTPTLIVWFTSSVLACSPHRDVFYNKILPGQQIPSILTELTRKVRQTQVPSLIIKLGEITNCLPENSKFKGSLLDPEFIVTDEGFQQVLNFYNFMASHEGNYVTVGLVTDQNKSKLFSPLNGGHQATFTLISSKHDPEQSFTHHIQVRPNNSYSSQIPGIDAYDAANLGATLSNDAKSKDEIKFIPELDKSLILQYSILNTVLYVVKRVTSKSVHPPGKATTSGDDRGSTTDSGKRTFDTLEELVGKEAAGKGVKKDTKASGKPDRRTPKFDKRGKSTSTSTAADDADSGGSSVFTEHDIIEIILNRFPQLKKYAKPVSPGFALG